MKSLATLELSRRDLLRAGAGLTLAVGAGSLITACSDAGSAGGATADATPLAPGHFLSIGADDIVTVISPNTEMGQGAYTGLATLVAEELDADWSQVRVVGALADVKRYGNPAFGGALQGTGGSTSVAAFYEPMRKAGATARAMLVSAAATKWKVPAAEITVENGVVSHAGSKKSARFGELTGAAAKLAVPADVPLKDPSTFRLIGQNRPRVDSRAKSTGTAQYTQDVKLPDMTVAVVQYPPRFGGKVKSFDAVAAKASAGVVDVVQIKTPVREGVAVIARDYWSAKKGRDLLKVEWDDGTRAAPGLGSDHGRLPRSGEEAGTRSEEGRRCREGHCRRRAPLRGVVRVPVPRACVDGAAELRRADHGRRLRDLERRADAHARPGHDRRVPRHQARAGEDQHALRRRQLRPSRQSARRLPARRRGDREGRRRTASR